MENSLGNRLHGGGHRVFTTGIGIGKHVGIGNDRERETRASGTHRQQLSGEKKTTTQTGTQRQRPGMDGSVQQHSGTGNHGLAATTAWLEGRARRCWDEPAGRRDQGSREKEQGHGEGEVAGGRRARGGTAAARSRQGRSTRGGGRRSATGRRRRCGVEDDGRAARRRTVAGRLELVWSAGERRRGGLSWCGTQGNDGGAAEVAGEEEEGRRRAAPGGGGRSRREEEQPGREGSQRPVQGRPGGERPEASGRGEKGNSGAG